MKKQEAALHQRQPPVFLYENGKIITDYTKRASTDSSLHGIKKIAEEQGEKEAYKVADKIIKNTYKTLMTRGMKGCYIYCTDKKLANYFKDVLYENKDFTELKVAEEEEEYNS